MTEATVLLNLPLHGVVLGTPGAPPPEWLVRQQLFMPALVASHQFALAECAAAARVEREVADLHRERDAWVRGLMELKQAVSKVDTSLKSMVDELREATVELASAIAGKLVFQKIDERAFPVDRLVDETLRRLNTHEPATVRLNPVDLETLRQKALPTEFIQNEREVRLVADSSLARGDCKAVAGEVTVIYELKRQIEQIQRELLSMVSGHAEPGT